MKRLLSMASIVILPMSAYAANPDSQSVVAAAKEIVGAWQLDFTDPEGVERTPVVLVGRQHEELVAWFVAEGEPELFKTTKLVDDSLVLTVRPKEREGIEVTLVAKLKGSDACVGEGTYQADDGETGSWRFSGRRITAADFDETQQWQLRFYTPDDKQREALVIVVGRGDELYAWYKGKEFDLPAQEFSMEGDNVEMLVTGKTRDGQDIEVRFRGAIDGDVVKGEAEYDVEGDTGRFPFSGKRKS